MEKPSLTLQEGILGHTSHVLIADDLLQLEAVQWLLKGFVKKQERMC